MQSNTARTVIEGTAQSPVLNGVLRPPVSLTPINMDNEEHVEQLRSFIRDYPCAEHQQFLESLLSAQDPEDHRVFVTEVIKSGTKSLALLSMEFAEGTVSLRLIPMHTWTNSERKAALTMLGAQLEDLALKQDWKRVFIKEPSQSGVIELRGILGRELPNGTIVEECN